MFTFIKSFQFTEKVLPQIQLLLGLANHVFAVIVFGISSKLLRSYKI
jgi:hypothetical protein